MTIRQVPRYSLAERERRWALTRELMAAEGVDALVVYGEHERHYPALYSHDVYFTNDRPGSIVIFCRDADPVVLVGTPGWVGGHIEARRQGADAWIEPHNLRVARHPHGVVDVLRQHGLEQAAIGVIGADPPPQALRHFLPIMPNALWGPMTQALPEATFTGVYEAFRTRSAPQSVEEQAVLAHAARIGDNMAQAMLEATKPGVTEADVVAAGMAEAYRHGSVAPAMTVQSGPGTISCLGPAYAYRPEAPRVLAEGDVVVAELYSCFGMRESQHQVTIALGEAHPDVERAALVARTSYTACLELLRPGNTFGDVVEVMQRPLRDAGGWNVHPLIRAGYPFGPIGSWGTGPRGRAEATRYGHIAEIPAMGTTVRLVPGMAFAVAPNAVIGDHTVSLGATAIVGESAPIELSLFSAQLLRA